MKTLDTKDLMRVRDLCARIEAALEDLDVTVPWDSEMKVELNTEEPAEGEKALIVTLAFYGQDVRLVVES